MREHTAHSVSFPWWAGALGAGIGPIQLWVPWAMAEGRPRLVQCQAGCLSLGLRLERFLLQSRAGEGGAVSSPPVQAGLER